MNTTTAHSPSVGFVLPRSAPAPARRLLQLLQRLRHGHLTLHLPDGSVQRFGSGSHDAPHASMTLHNWAVCEATLKSGDIGFAESYIAGDWTTPDLTGLMRLFLVNRREVEDLIFGTWWGRLAYRVRHLLNRNSKANSRKNIHAHYDLGNAFYSLWLDETMNYSSAWWADPEMDLPTAQRAKVARALDQANVRAGDRVLEVGCGWGALAEMATVERGASVTGVTLSTEQLAFAQERLARQGVALAGAARETAWRWPVQADLRLQDYRDIDDGPYDAVCSIEMIEAVGREYWPTYFETLHRVLKPGGRACIQSITIDDALYERYIRSTDFIQQYVFPGGCLPSPSVFEAQARAAGFEVIDRFAFGPDYGRTLALWREAFLRQQDAVRALGFDTRFMRIWEFYLCYCEAGFAEGDIDVMQFTLQRA
jgi:cyclopropane-fatty-acyl-phospholipid synthase